MDFFVLELSGTMKTGQNESKRFGPKKCPCILGGSKKTRNSVVYLGPLSQKDGFSGFLFGQPTICYHSLSDRCFVAATSLSDRCFTTFFLRFEVHFWFIIVGASKKTQAVGFSVDRAN